MARNLRFTAAWLLGVALAVTPVLAAAAGGRGGGGGGGRGGGGGGGAGGGGHAGARMGGGQVGGGARTGGGGQVGGGSRASGGGQVGSGARAGGGGQAGSGVRAAPRGAAQVAPRGEVRTAPRGEVRTPSGEVRTAPRGDVRAAPGGAARARYSWDRDWAQHRSTWDNRGGAGRDWDRGHTYHGRDHWHGKGHAGWHYPWYRSAFWWPGYGWGWGWGSYWWPGYYGWPVSYWSRFWSPGYYGHGYPHYRYGYGYPYHGDYVYDSGDDGVAPYTAAAPPSTTTAAAVDADAQAEAEQYFNRAERAFREGDFRSAMRLAAHASIDNPEDADVHLLLSLAMFAQGDYQGAAMEARGLAAMGKMPNWDTVFGMYGRLEPYEKQLRALEQFAGKTPSAPEGRFLLGFHYAMAGHREAAQQEFLAALKTAPEDSLTAELLTHMGGKVPADIARRQSEAAAQPQGKPSAPAQGKPPAPPQGSRSGQPPAQPPSAPIPKELPPTDAPVPTVPPPPIRK